MLCDNVGIINTGNLVAYDTPQGLKDSLLESNRQEITEALSKISDENDDAISQDKDLEKLSLKRMSVLLKNQNDSIIESIKQSDDVKDIEVERNGRINLRVDSFDDMAVQNVLNQIISSGGIIKSIYTEEPSLEDVFIKSTSEVNEDDRA
jgi:ABC-2 type transport system ATP-binding protein